MLRVLSTLSELKHLEDVISNIYENLQTPPNTRGVQNLFPPYCMLDNYYRLS